MDDIVKNHDKACLWAAEYLEASGRKRWTVDQRDNLADAFMVAVAKTGGNWGKWKAPAVNQKHMHDADIIEGLKLHDMTRPEIARRIGVTHEYAKGILHRMKRDGALATAGRSGRDAIYTLA